MVLEEGKEYISIKMKTAKALELVLKAVSESKDNIDFPAYINDDKTENDSKHNYKSEGVAVWKNIKKGPQQNNVPQEQKVV